jgi:hypothetical protein
VLSNIAANVSLKRSGAFGLAHESLFFGCVYTFLKKEKDFASETDFKLYFPRNPSWEGKGIVWSIPWLTDNQKRIFAVFVALEEEMGLQGITERWVSIRCDTRRFRHLLTDVCLSWLCFAHAA